MKKIIITFLVGIVIFWVFVFAIGFTVMYGGVVEPIIVEARENQPKTDMQKWADNNAFIQALDKAGEPQSYDPIIDFVLCGAVPVFYVFVSAILFIKKVTKIRKDDLAKAEKNQ